MDKSKGLEAGLEMKMDVLLRRFSFSSIPASVHGLADTLWLTNLRIETSTPMSAVPGKTA